MVMIVFIGMFVARMRSVPARRRHRGAGHDLSAFRNRRMRSACCRWFSTSAIVSRSRRPVLGILLVVVIVAAFNLFSVGTVIFEPIRKLVGSIMPDATFTGRTEIWELALQYVARRPITGYGFSAFWGTPQVVYGIGENASWVNAATDAHNAYLNLALEHRPARAVAGRHVGRGSADRRLLSPVRRDARERRRYRCCFCASASTASIASCFESSIFSRSAKCGSSSSPRPSACAIVAHRRHRCRAIML